MAHAILACLTCRREFLIDNALPGEALCPNCQSPLVSPHSAAETPCWYYAKDRRKHGPVTRAQLQQLLITGDLHPADLIVLDGSRQWLAAAEVPGLVPASASEPKTVRQTMAIPVAARTHEPHGADFSPVPALASLSSPDSPETVHEKAGTHVPPVAQVLSTPEIAALDAQSQWQPEWAAPPPKTAIVPEIAGYEILGVLGRGGMGVVYKARHVQLNRLVALKMILAGGHAGPEQRERFLVEARAVARLQHPHIVQIHEIGEHEGQPYFSLEFVDGGSLARHLDGTPQPPSDAARLVEVLAQATHVAHQKGIVHRDLKPANILLSLRRDLRASTNVLPAPSLRLNQCMPKITDFGLAKQLDDESGQTRTGAVMGTPSYMASEQAEGRIHDIGARTDVYALGAILYEMLTGRPPFKAATVLETLEQVRTVEPVPPSRLQPNLPRDLETICLKCLEKELHKRYFSAEALTEDLHRFLNGEPIQARPVGQSERMLKWAKRQPMVAALLAAFLLTLSCGTAVATYFAIKADLRAREATNNETLARQEKDRADEQTREAQKNARKAKEQKDRADRETKRAQEDSLAARRHLYVAQMNLAQRDWENADIDRLLQLLDAQRPEQTGGIDLRSFEWYYWWRLCHSAMMTLTGQGGEVRSVCHSRDGKLLASASDDGTIWTWEASTGKPLLIFKGHQKAVNCAVFSPDSRFLASCSGDGTIKLWDIAADKEIHTFRGHAASVAGVAFAPDGKSLVSGSDDMTIKIWDVTSGKEMRTIKGHSGKVTGVAFSPDGHSLASSSTDFTAKVWDVAVGTELLSLNSHISDVLCVAYSPDGKRLATGSLWDKNRVKIWDLSSGKDMVTIQGHTWPVHSVCFSPDGRRLVTASRDRTMKVWNVETGQELHVYKGHTHSLSNVCYSPDGQRLVSSGGLTVKVWNASMAPDEHRGSNQTEPITGVAFSPDSKLFASPYRDNQVTVHDLATFKIGTTLKGHKGRVNRLAFSPDGRFVATASEDHTATIWNVQTGNEIQTFTGHRGPVTCVSFSPDGKSVVSSAMDNSVIVWETRTGKQRMTFKGHTGPVFRCSFSPDGKSIASLGARKKETDGFGLGHLLLWSAETGERILAPISIDILLNTAVGLAFCSEGKLIASTPATGGIRIWDTKSGKSVHFFQSRGLHSDVAFASDGRRLISSSQDAIVRIWDMTTGTEILTLKGHGNSLQCVAFSPDGKHVAAGSTLSFFEIWDATLPTWITPIRRAWAYAGIGEWKDAANDFAQAADKNVADPSIWYHLALVQLQLGNREGYRKACAGVLKQFDQRKQQMDPMAAENTLIANQVAWTCSLAPGAVKDYTPVLKLAEAAVTSNAKSYSSAHTLGAALYRSGKFKEADEQLKRAADMQVRAPTTWFFLAMTLYHLDQKAEAQEWLEQAILWHDQIRRRTPQDAIAGQVTWHNLPWTERITVELLRREAEKLIKKNRKE